MFVIKRYLKDGILIMAIIEKTYSKPVIDLNGPDGNAFYLLGTAMNLCKQIGISSERTEEILDEMLQHNIDLLLTLDCGTTSFNILDKKKYLVFDTIVIDHHISEYKLPKVFSVINPNRYDEQQNYKDLAAVGVTYLFLIVQYP